MTNRKYFSQFFSNSILLFTAMVFLFMTSCQKDDLQDVSSEASIEVNDKIPDLALEKIILEYNFKVQTQGLSDEQIRQQYNEFMQLLPEEDRNSLVEMVEQIMEQTPSFDINITSQGASIRAEETILNGTDDLFGFGVATVGNKVYVGATQEQKVYEYSKTGGSYVLTDEITPTGASDDFGRHVFVSGSWMAVSAPDFGPPFGNNPGQVFMFKKQGGSWVQKTILTGPAGENNFSGQGMVLKGGKLAVISSGSGFPSPGSTISVFELSGNNWSLSGTIFEPTYDWFGIDMDEGGNRIVGTGSVGNNFGTVRASIFSKNGSNWSLEDEVIIPSPIPFSIAFPRDVAIQDNTVVLTALLPGNKHWVIENNGGDWEVAQELLIPPGLPFTNRWAEIQGSTIIIGAASNNNFISDAVHVFENSGSTWNLDETLTLSDNGEDAIMWNVAISGNTIVAGLPGIGGPGKVYVFD